MAFVGPMTRTRQPGKVSRHAEKVQGLDLFDGRKLASELYKEEPLWWMKPGYLTPNGYDEPPHWTMEGYEVAIEEMTYGVMEQQLISELKERGMTIEEIRAKASSYEFIEDDELPKMTDKMKFFMQVLNLHQGTDQELIDMRDFQRKFVVDEI